MVAEAKGIEALLRRWPPSKSRRLQLYAQPSPNGVKVMAMLAECRLDHDLHRIEFGEDGTRSTEYLGANPDGRIPMLLDPDGPGGRPMLLAESNAILRYLAEKTHRFLPSDARDLWQIEQWLFWQAASLGATFGQIGYFHRFEGRAIEDPRPLAKHVAEARRLLAQLEDHLHDRDWLVGDYSIADIAVLPLIRNLIGFYDAGELVRFAEFANVARWLARWKQRPAISDLLKEDDK